MWWVLIEGSLVKVPVSLAPIRIYIALAKPCGAQYFDSAKSYQCRRHSKEMCKSKDSAHLILPFVLSLLFESHHTTYEQAEIMCRERLEMAILICNFSSWGEKKGGF